MQVKNVIFYKIVSLFLILVSTQCLFSRHYLKCRVLKGHNGKQLGQLIEQRVPAPPIQYYIQPLIQTRKPIQYKQMNYFYHEYIGAGGSGQVYLVEDLETKQAKVLKRFFKQKPQQFEQQNFIMHKLNYSVGWMKDSLNGIPQKTDYQKDVNKHKATPTIAIYPSKQSITLRDVQFFPHEASMIFYKILMQLQKTHKNSIIHNDIKMGNVMVNSLGLNFKYFQTQLIDWNLASYYYLGLQGNTRKGTVCYFSPQQLMRASHMTPAIDVWALGVVMWTFFTDDKPFFTDCKKDNLQAIASLVGIQKLIQMHKKYRFPYIDEYYNLLVEHVEHPKKYRAKNLKDAVPEEREQFFNDDLIDIFERIFTPDPEQRITVTELLRHKYFKNVKKLPAMFKQKRRVQDEKKKKKQAQKKQN